MKLLRYHFFAALIAITTVTSGQSAKQTAGEHKTAREKLIGAWHLLRIDASGADAASPQPKGMLIYTGDGHMSVQLVYPRSADVPSDEYVKDGYEASFGSYDVDEVKGTLTHHVQGSITRDLLTGRDLPRKFEFSAEGHLIIRPANADEHWSVTWEHY